ncbi:MAG: hypothetical protein KAQ62_12775 [Cyclobacteriaceae bacterium]|nr:hypothetical protein [Cyclobacteriaceae bacterium]
MNTGNYHQLSSKILLAIVISFMIACGSDKKKGSDATKEFDAAQEQMKENVERVIRDIPSPAEIPYIIQSTGADYNPNIINDYKKYESYTISAKKAAFNLGVYATDIGYLSSYGKTQEALNYMDVCLKLTETVGAQDAIDFAVLERFEKNLSNPDSLGRIIDQVISNSDSYLQANDRNNIAALMIGGTFIEALYISTQIIDTYPKDLLPDDMRLQILAPLVSMLVKQKESLKDVIDLLEGVDNKEDWEIATINSLQELYDNYTKFDPLGKIQDGRGNEVLNDEVLARLTTQVDSIRTNVVY